MQYAPTEPFLAPRSSKAQCVLDSLKNMGFKKIGDAFDKAFPNADISVACSLGDEVLQKVLFRYSDCRADFNAFMTYLRAHCLVREQVCEWD